MLDRDHLPRWRLLSYSALAVPIAALGLPFVVHLPAFYKNELGISATIVGLIIMLARFWDVFTDPIFGAVSDHLPTRWGRRRPWIVLAMPIQMLCAWFLFMPEQGASALYLGFWLFLIYLSSTMIAISHMSWGAELSPYYHQRSRIQGFREFSLIAGMLFVLALPSLWGTSSRTDTVYLMGAFIIFFTPLCGLITLCGTPKESIQAPIVARLNVKAAFMFFVSNRNLRKLLFVALMAAGLLPGITGGLYIDTITHVYGLGEEANLLLLVYFAAAIASVPFWIWVSKKTSKHRAFSLAMFYGAVLLSCAGFVPYADFWFMFFGLLAYGIVYGAGPFLLRALMADFSDLDELESGQKRTGLCYALLNMTDKIGLALAVGITFPILDLIQFNPNSTNNPETLNWLLMLYVLPSVILMLLSGLLMWNYPFDEKKQEEVRAILGQRYST